MSDRKNERSLYLFSWDWKEDLVALKTERKFIITIDTALDVMLIGDPDNNAYQIRELKTDKFLWEFTWRFKEDSYPETGKFISRKKFILKYRYETLFLVDYDNVKEPTIIDKNKSADFDEYIANIDHIYSQGILAAFGVAEESTPVDKNRIADFQVSLNKIYLCILYEKSGSIQIWDLACLSCIREFQYPIRSGKLQLSIDAQLLVIDGYTKNNQIIICNIFNGIAPQNRVPVHNDTVLTSAISKDNRCFITSGFDKNIEVLRLDDNQALKKDRTLPGLKERSLSISNDGKILVTAGAIWNLATGGKICSFVKSDWICSSIVSSDGRKIIVCGRGQDPAQIDMANPDKVTTLPVAPPSNMFFTMALSPDNRFLIAGTYSKVIFVWDLWSSQTRAVLSGHLGSVSSLCFSKTGKKIISATGNTSNLYGMGCSVPSDSTIRIWDMETGRCDRILTGHQGSICCLRILHKQQALLSVCDGGLINLWDMTSWECIKTICNDGRNCNVHLMDEDTIVIQEPDYLSAFDLKTGKKIATMPVQGISHSNSSGSKILVGKETGQVELYELVVNGKVVSPSNVIMPAETVRLWERNQEFPNGKWSDKITSVCNHCGALFETPPNILDAIKQINGDNQVGPDDSPCLKLPDEAWDDPKLLFDCPKCGGKLKSNPFVVDNKGRWD